MNEQVGLRGKAWFKALTGGDTPDHGDPNSVLATTAPVGNESALFLCVVPDEDSRFPCVRDGQVGLQEAFSLAAHVRAVIAQDHDKPREAKRPVIASVEVKSEADARREEPAGIFCAASASADASAPAMMAGHRVISLVAGHS